MFRPSYEIEKKKGNLLGVESSERFTKENFNRETEAAAKLKERDQEYEKKLRAKLATIEDYVLGE